MNYDTTYGGESTVEGTAQLATGIGATAAAAGQAGFAAFASSGSLAWLGPVGIGLGVALSVYDYFADQAAAKKQGEADIEKLREQQTKIGQLIHESGEAKTSEVLATHDFVNQASDNIDDSNAQVLTGLNTELKKMIGVGGAGALDTGTAESKVVATQQQIALETDKARNKTMTQADNMLADISSMYDTKIQGYLTQQDNINDQIGQIKASTGATGAV
tara:strand:+ start:1027 stop:1680 length:654 start_codon:yes stop_codon:yes gene_type:complete